jgi:formate C-acetyltransferase
MNERIELLKQGVRDGDHHVFRKTQPIDVLAECEAEGLSWPQRSARLTRRQCEAETPVILSDERIAFTRTLPAAIPPIYTPEDWQRLTAGRTLHELGSISNICVDWGYVLSQGLLGRRQAAVQARQTFQDDPAAGQFLNGALETIDAVLDLAQRYAAAARKAGREDLASMLDYVPANPPRTFHEGLQALRIVQAAVWLSGHYHVGLGRFDQTMWPYLEADLAAGRLALDEAEELLAEFFISLNKDSDLYPGVQQGDNGQTITLGGVDREGRQADNELTRMVLRVSRDLAMIDPKVNLRISAHTDLDLLRLAAELTRKGLGFPQYSNDDVVIPGLTAHGYALEDARDYAVAACWEFLIPGRGLDVVNIGAVSFPAAADDAIRGGLADGEDMAGIFQRVEDHIRRQVANLAGAYERLLLPPAPYYSVLMNGCLENGRDLSQGPGRPTPPTPWRLYSSLCSRIKP